MRETEVDWQAIYTVAFDPALRTQEESYKRYRSLSSALPSQSTVLRALHSARAVGLFVLPGHVPLDRLTDAAQDPLKQGAGWKDMDRLAQCTRFPSLVTYIDKKRVAQALEAWKTLPAAQQEAVRKAADAAWAQSVTKRLDPALAGASGTCSPPAQNPGPRPEPASGTGALGRFLVAPVTALIQNVLPGPPAVRSVGPQPLIGSIRKQLVVVDGSHFAEGCRVTLFDGNAVPFILRPDQVKVLSPRRMHLTVGLDTLPDTWTIQVTNPDGRVSSPLRFDVQAAPNPGPPLLSTAIPSQVQAMAAPQELRLQGSGFMRGLKVVLVADLERMVLEGDDAHLRDSLNLTVTVRFYSPPDQWLVYVENPNGQKSNYLFLKVTGGG